MPQDLRRASVHALSVNDAEAMAPLPRKIFSATVPETRISLVSGYDTYRLLRSGSGMQRDP